MRILDMTFSDIGNAILSFLINNKGTIIFWITFAFGGFGVDWLNKKISLFKMKFSDSLIVRERGIRNYSDVVKKLGISKVIHDEFSEYSDYLLLQYGSSVDISISRPNDYDFIVLLLGHPKDNVKHIHNSGSYPLSRGEDSVNVDIVYRDYLSFLFSACSGMPYENSVIVRSRLLYGHRGYYNWLRNITKNILIDRDFLVRRFEEKILAEREIYRNELKYHSENRYDVIRAGYYYITSMIQLCKLRKLNKIITQKEVVSLANVRDIASDFFSDLRLRCEYIQMVDWLKRLNMDGLDNDNENSIESIRSIMAELEKTAMESQVSQQ